MASAQAMKLCPSCGNQVSDLLRIDAGMRLRIQETMGPDYAKHNEICPNCYSSISGQISKGAKLRAEANAREQNKLILWKSRVNLVKQGRKLMAQKALSEAAVTFEKYLRVLEVVYDKKPGDLTPELFKDSARTKEITVVASVLWDLVRIYDTTPRYGDRQKKAASKLAQFLQLTPIQAEIVRKARLFEGTSKNPNVIKEFLKKADKGGGRCYIATATFGSREAPEVQVFYRFRDNVLLSSRTGSLLVSIYYFVSPPMAFVVERSAFLRRISKRVLTSLALHLKK